MSVLFPEGIHTLADLPHTIFDAIVVGMQFVRFEELEEDEKPKKAIYLDQKKLEAHFAAVKKRRKERSETDKDGRSREIEDPVSNDAAKGFVPED